VFLLESIVEFDGADVKLFDSFLVSKLEPAHVKLEL
jgi:hypothetical protein